MEGELTWDHNAYTLMGNAKLLGQLVRDLGEEGLEDSQQGGLG